MQPARLFAVSVALALVAACQSPPDPEVQGAAFARITIQFTT